MSWPAAKAKKVVIGVRRHQLEQLRRPPQLKVRAAAAGRQRPTVYYLCPDTNSPTGGIRVIYRHVDALNSIGVPARVIHGRPNFSCTWFRHDTRVLSAAETILTPTDVLVVPEYYGRHLAEIPDGPRLVLFNQNAYQTFAGPDAAGSVVPYPDTDRLEAIIVVSRDNAEYMRYAFPRTPTRTIRDCVDTRTFYPSHKQPGRVVSFMPRKRPGDCAQVLSLLSRRGILNDWELLTISNFTEAETADALRRSALFLSFSEQEGFGMPPAEAMASGCYVTGFTGLAGREFFGREFSRPVEEGDILGFARAVESAVESFTRDGQALRQLGLAAAARISADYSPQMQLADLTRFFGELLGPAAG